MPFHHEHRKRTYSWRNKGRKRRPFRFGAASAAPQLKNGLLDAQESGPRPETGRCRVPRLHPDTAALLCADYGRAALAAALGIRRDRDTGCHSPAPPSAVV
ncbi:hypothetical protein Ga0100231_023470 [Opitutaceae bacterium TAV4]|uniref:hypothetical protein n=1 Tax=Geminisphaera colitermitum TaxID=1148786 RepID=UPI000158CA75|nr:hypothetical protein [Geminisphaera colitermitum]RRJ96745.1 hypothetical protein Ga0100231_023470 [Opitutaceae bacterium TAV4]